LSLCYELPLLDIPFSPLLAVLGFGNKLFLNEDFRFNLEIGKRVLKDLVAIRYFLNYYLWFFNYTPFLTFGSITLRYAFW